MIYLFDEKKDRQRDYGWSDEKFSHLNDIIKVFNSYEFLDNEEKLRGKCDILLRHESFFFNVPNVKKQIAHSIENRMNDACKQGTLKQVIFSGGTQSRKIIGDKAFIPVSYLYQNLNYFLEKYRDGKWVLDDIVYGENSVTEKKILKLLEDANNQMLDDDGYFRWEKEYNSHVLLVHSDDENRLDPPSFFEKHKTNLSTLRYNIDEEDPISDAFLNDYVNHEFLKTKYDKVFIPLCFGPTLSDYNGLRLAIHIRATIGANQFVPIYIYSPIGVKSLLDNEYFDILRTTNVFVIDYSCKGLYDALLKQENVLNETIKRSLSLIHLHPPKNYMDSHSVANEWAIYRWTQLIDKNIKNNEIDKITETINHNLYFKYLQTIYPPQEAEQLNSTDLIIKGITKEMTGEYLDEPSILFVDDEAERGWYDLFKIIIKHNNPNLYIDYLGKEHFAGRSQDEICDIIYDKVKNEDFNIVILDFRLHSNDFVSEKIEDVTGHQALRKIKEFNSGIQVVVFSATNKVWNLLELQKNDANGFIIKESPANSKDEHFTANVIRSFITIMSDAVANCFKKTFFERCTNILSNLGNTQSSTDEIKKLIKAFKKQIELIKNNIPNIHFQDKNSLDITFINCFNVFEILKDFYIRLEADKTFSVGDSQGDLFIFDKKNKAYRTLKQNVTDSPKDPSMPISIVSIMFYLKLGKNSLLQSINKIITWRNDFIHGTKPHFDKDELVSLVDILETISHHIRP